MEAFLEMVKTITTIVGCISACIALAVTIIKPLRRRVIDAFVRKSQDTKRDAKIDQIDQKLDKILKVNHDLEDRLARVEQNVLENEADRIRAELFDCGNRCRRGIRLHPEEMDHIRAIYHKYKDVLKQNHEGDMEFDFITQYYNQQSFPAYHIQQNDYEER